MIRRIRSRVAGHRGGVAQLGEHLLCKQGVTGSIPVVSRSVAGEPASLSVSRKVRDRRGLAGWGRVHHGCKPDSRLVQKPRSVSAIKVKHQLLGLARPSCCRRRRFATVGGSTHATAYEDQLCVLLPERAHVGRVNSILRRENSTRYQATAQELRRAYAEAYSLIGDYCAGGEKGIKRELLAIVDAEFQKLGVR